MSYTSGVRFVHSCGVVGWPVAYLVANLCLNFLVVSDNCVLVEYLFNLVGYFSPDPKNKETYTSGAAVDLVGDFFLVLVWAPTRPQALLLVGFPLAGHLLKQSEFLRSSSFSLMIIFRPHLRI